MARSIELDFDEIEGFMRQLRPVRILLQLPSGIKRLAAQIAGQLGERFGCEVIISGDSCFGACDVPLAILSQVDVIVQVGHSPMPSIDYPVPTIFLPGKLFIDLPKSVESALPMLRSPVGLLAISQHLHLLDEAKNLLEKKGLEILIGKGSMRTAAPGHILGCDYSSAVAVAPLVSSFLLLGGGRFHSIGIKLLTKKPVIVIDPERDTPVKEEVDYESFLRRRFAIIQAIAEAKSIGIIISLKLGQARLGLAQMLLKELERDNREGHLITMDEILPEKLIQLGFDAYISTACPRIALDDVERFEKPLGTPTELLVALNRLDWKDYMMDSWCLEIFESGGE